MDTMIFIGLPVVLVGSWVCMGVLLISPLFGPQFGPPLQKISAALTVVGVFGIVLLTIPWNKTMGEALELARIFVLTVPTIVIKQFVTLSPALLVAIEVIFLTLALWGGWVLIRWVVHGR